MLILVLWLSSGTVARAQTPAARKQSGAVFDVRVGLVAAGGGDIVAECTGGLCTDSSEDLLSYDDQSGAALGADVLARLGPTLRLGGGLLYQLDTEIESRGDKLDFGTDLAAMGIVEGVFPAGPTIDLAARGLVGAVVLLPGGDLEDALQELEDQCNDSSYYDPYYYGYGGPPPDTTCEVDTGPFFGWTVGAGGSVIFALEGLSLRFDAVVQYMQLPWLELHEESGGETLDGTAKLVGTRFWLGLGVEI